MEKIIPATRTRDIKYAVRDVVLAAQKLEKQGRKILYLNIGDPIKYDFQTPTHLFEAVDKARNISSSYSDSMGDLNARKAIAREAVRKGIKNIVSDDVLIANGASEAIMMAMGSLLNGGENILTPSPGYPLYTGLVSFYGAKMNEYYLDEENGWQPDVEDMAEKINNKTKGIILINPNNPTGSLTGEKTIKEIIKLARDHDLVLFSDEIYDKILFDNETHHSTAALADDVPVLTFNGLSKSYLAPGWRVGWVVFHDPTEVMKDYRDAIAKIARTRLCSVHPKQHAIKAALEGDHSHLTHMNEKKLKERRDFTYKRLNEIPGISCVKPKGAFYAFPRIDVPIDNDEKFVLDLLDEQNVLVVHGSGFGQKPDTHHFRIVFLPDMNILEKAYNGIEEFMKKHYS